VTRRAKFLTRVLIGFAVGVGLGLLQMGWSEQTAPIVFEYGVVLGAMGFAITNYLELRQKLMGRARAGTLPPPKTKS
jgi:hypothetical protein